MLAIHPKSTGNPKERSPFVCLEVLRSWHVAAISLHLAGPSVHKPQAAGTIGAHGPDVSGAELGAVWGHVGCQVSKLRSPKVVLQTTNSSFEPLKLRIQAGFKGVLLVCICSRI